MMKLKFTALVASIAFVTMAGSAVAQQSQKQMQQRPAQQGQTQGNPSRTTALTSAEKNFLKKSAQDSQLEFASAQLAVQKAKNPQVADYALRLMQDHSQYNTQLMQLARQNGIVLPVELDSQQRTKLNSLMQLKNTAFDQEFIKESTQANREDVTSLQSASQKFNNPGVQNFVSQFLPVQQQHLQIATALNNGDRTNSSSSSGQ